MSLTHGATRKVITIGLSTDGRRLTFGRAVQLGFPGWVRLRGLETGVCGGDFEGRASLPRWASKMVMGHEGLLRAIESGGDDGHRVEAGELYVAIPGRRTCVADPGATACPLGPEGCGEYANRGTSRFHGFASLDVIEDPRYLVPVQASLGSYAVLAEPLAIVRHALRTAAGTGMISQERVGVVGLGALGLLLTAELVDMGMRVDVFDIFRNGVRGDALQAIGDRARWGDVTRPSRYPLVFEVAGGPGSLADAVRLTEMSGTLIALGLPMHDRGDSIHRETVARGLTVHGVVSARRIDYFDALKGLAAWTTTRPEFLRRLITHRIPLTEYRRALAIPPEERIKVVLLHQG